ncbi:MAG: TULIP family P47-like protein [Nitrospirota bacterium]|nr:TULIP family P47-like protein [Nitrospirota bacterium]
MKGIIDTADTYGWDTVFGIHIGDVNAAIIKAGSSPKSFDVADPDDAVSATGTFGDWQLISGGSGEIVRLQIPIQTAEIHSPGNTDKVINATALVDVRLNFLHQKDPTGKSSHHLRVRTKPASVDESIVTIWQIVYQQQQKLSFIGKAAFRELLALWLNENLDSFDHVFATVDLNRVADKGAFQWMQPTDVSYAYSDFGADDGVLAVLCMTGHRPSAGLIQQASPKLIPDRERAGLLISRNRMLSELILPLMPQVFDGSKPADYKISASGDSILNAHQGIRFTVHPKDKDPYTATVQELSVTIDGEELQMEVLTKADVSPGIYAWCRTQNFLAIKLINKPDGTQTLGYEPTRTVPPAHWTTKDPGIEITEEILGLVALIATAIAIVVTAGAAIPVIAMIIGLAAGVMALTTTIIEDVGNGDAPAIGDLVLNASAAIIWPDSKDFALTTAGLNSSLQLGGNPSFA